MRNTRGLRRLPDEGELAARREDHNEVAGALDVRQAVRDADDRFAFIGERPEQAHHFAIGLFVQARCHLVKEKQAGLAEDLVCEAGALDLTATEMPDERVAVRP